MAIRKSAHSPESSFPRLRSLCVCTCGAHACVQITDMDGVGKRGRELRNVYTRPSYVFQGTAA